MHYRNGQLGDCDFFRNCASAVPVTNVQSAPSAAFGQPGAAQCQCEEKNDWWLWLLIGYLAWRAYAEK
jgi:hypothetical protein